MTPEINRPVPCSAAPELFFPPEGERAGTPKQMSRVWMAQQYCKRCPVADWCREQPRAAEDGVWGGVDERTRAKAAGVKYRPNRPLKNRTPVRCGTSAGAAKHRRLKQTVCPACREADAADRALRRL